MIGIPNSLVYNPFFQQHIPNSLGEFEEKVANTLVNSKLIIKFK